MKFLASFLFIIVSSVTILAQKQANIWYFGNKAGINFNVDPPVALTDGEMNTSEGCSSIADENGNLLFYTNGITVWNSVHDTMINGKDLKGDPSSIQSSLVVPKPGSDSIYYIFTVDAGSGVTDGLNYSEVDITLNGGLGEVLLATKNTQLTSPTTEQLTAVLHANQTDIWVITHARVTNRFFVYLVTSAGVGVPQMINVGNAANSPIACLKASPDGRRLASTNRGSITELFDFDAATGVISNPVELNSFAAALYGNEFSPNSQLLYLSSSAGSIYQYNLTASDIPGSETIIGSAGALGTFQLAPDNKIYVARFFGDTLGVINNPDSLGVACDYNHGGFYLDGRTSIQGLPQFIQSFLKGPNFSFSNLLCANNPTFFTNNVAVFDSIRWDFGDLASGTANTATLENPTHTFANSGAYIVSSIVFNGAFSDTSMQTVNILPVAMSATLTMICPGDSLLVDGVFRSDAGTYNDTIIGGASTGCDSIASVTLSFFLPSVSITSSVSEICLGESVNIIATGGNSYSWSPTTSLNIAAGNNVIASPELNTTYLVIGTGLNGCQNTANISITVTICEEEINLRIPNVFTPNGDDQNDLFKVDGVFLNTSIFEMKVYNRWGQLVFEADQVDKGWDGRTSNGTEVTEGTYFYTIININLSGKEETFSGSITLIK